MSFLLDDGVYGGSGTIADYTLPRPAFLGFSGRTGGATNNHWVKEVSTTIGRASSCAALPCHQCTGECGWCSSSGGFCSEACVTTPEVCELPSEEEHSGSDYCPEIQASCYSCSGSYGGQQCGWCSDTHTCSANCATAVGECSAAHLYDHHGLPDGIIAYWSLDGDGSDAGPNGLDAAETTAAWVAGVSNLAFRIDGADALVVENSDILSPHELTMSAWIRPTMPDGASGPQRTVMNKENEYEFGVVPSNGALQSALSPCWRWFGESRVSLHEWTAVAIAYDGANTLHFLSGVLAEQQACDGGGNLAHTDADFKIGGRTWTSATMDEDSLEFVGDIDEVMLFDRALRADEVVMLNGLVQRAQIGVSGSAASARSSCDAACVAALPAGLVGFWPLDGDGQDRSGSNNHGTPARGEWATGLFGLAFKFDGDDVVEIPSSPRLNVQALTTLAWVHPTELDFTTDVDIIVNRAGFEMGIATGMQVRERITDAANRTCQQLYTHLLCVDRIVLAAVPAPTTAWPAGLVSCACRKWWGPAVARCTGLCCRLHKPR
eukprot:SAG31_NODE_197_length_20660_cov_8.861368_13_plen_549_part_00